MAPEQTSDATYTVLARRYRPGTFDECIGQEHVARALRNAIQAGRVAHAYLFAGSRGVGKTSMARILAKALNCEKGPTTEPCGACESCVAIAAGSDLDVVEIDGASNRGIDEIRELRQAVGYRPSRSRYKIYIIDEVHMLTKEAFNALLKTLEEPPAHVKFVFATTEAQKIPITILSRCQRYDFAGIGLRDIERRLKEIVEAEGMEADDDAIEIVARRARGSMRDSQSLLDQVLAFSSGRLTAETVHELLGTAGDQRVADLADAVLAGDPARALAMVQTAVAEGVQLGEWLEQTVDYFRDLLVLTVDPAAEVLSMPSRMREGMLEQARRLTPERIMEMMDILAACRMRMRSAGLARTLVEMTLVRLCRLDHFLNLSEALSADPPPAAAARPGGSAIPAASGSAPARPAPASKKNGPDLVPAGPQGLTAPHARDDVPGSHGPTPDADAPPTDAQGLRLAPHDDSTDSNGRPPTANGPSSAANGQPPAAEASGPAFDLNEASAGEFLTRLRGEISDPFLASALEQAARGAFRPPATLVVMFPPTAATSRKHCEASLDALRSIASRLARRPVQISFEHASAGHEAHARPAPPKSQFHLREEALRDPLVQKAQEILGAKIVGDVARIPPPAAKPDKPGEGERKA